MHGSKLETGLSGLSVVASMVTSELLYTLTHVCMHIVRAYILLLLSVDSGFHSNVRVMLGL